MLKPLISYENVRNIIKEIHFIPFNTYEQGYKITTNSYLNYKNKLTEII